MHCQCLMPCTPTPRLNIRINVNVQNIKEIFSNMQEISSVLYDTLNIFPEDRIDNQILENLGQNLPSCAHIQDYLWAHKQDAHIQAIYINLRT